MTAWVALDPVTVGVLRDHRALMASGRNASGGLLFRAHDGGPVHPERMYQAFKRAVIVIDVQLLLAVLSDTAPGDIAAAVAVGEVFTTGSWYYRLRRDVTEASAIRSVPVGVGER